MRTVLRAVLVVAALVAVLSAAFSLPAVAAQQSTVTKFSGTIGTSGSWTRTIIDISEPNEPGGGKTTASYNVVVNYTAGMTDVQLAAAYRNACGAALPAPNGNPNGYAAVFEQNNNKRVKLSKQAGTYNFSDAGLPSTCSGPGFANGIQSTLDCMLIETGVPVNAEDAPIGSTAALASLALGLIAIAWWTRRRRRLA